MGALPTAVIGQKFQEAYEEHERDVLNQFSGASTSTNGDRRSRGSRATLLRAVRQCNVSEERNAPSFTDMSRRLRLMRLPPSVRSHNLGMMVRDLADDIEEVGAMQ